MTSMLFDYPELEYGQDDSDYKNCKNFDEVKVLRLVKTYVDFVLQRYSTRVNMGFTNFNPNSRGKSLRTTSLFRDLVTNVTDHLKDRDPAHFIAFVFEFWPKRSAYSAFLKKDVAEHSGFAYPSWRFILLNSAELLRSFHNQPNYTPRDFVPVDDATTQYAEAVENRMWRWCNQYGKTPRDYWLNPANLFPPFLSYREFPYAYAHEHGIKHYAREIKKKFDFTPRELKQFLKDLEVAQDELFDASYALHTDRENQGAPPRFNFIRVLDLEDVVDTPTMERIQYALEAQEKGRNIELSSFEEETERVVNYIDYDSADTALFYLYGIGDQPRRRFD